MFITFGRVPPPILGVDSPPPSPTLKTRVVVNNMQSFNLIRKEIEGISVQYSYCRLRR